MATASAGDHTQPRKRARQDDSIKETLESLVIAFVLAFVFRAFVVEAFVIPTGSMAPTLMGAHLRVDCEQCGYTFQSDLPDHSSLGQGEDRAPVALRQAEDAYCPMCLYNNPLPRGTQPASGDRILVQKYVYELAQPRRWDVAVFKAPHQPQINYIKRLVGLPGEAIHILDGNIYVHPLDEHDQPGDAPDGWRIARKTDRPDVQRAVWQPIYHSQYVPLDSGHLGATRRTEAWETPWTPTGESADAWDLAGRRNYHFDTDQPGRIRFDFERGGDEHPRSLYPYNQFTRAGILRQAARHPIEEVRVAAMFQPETDGLSVTLATTARLHDRGDDADDRATERLEATIDAAGTVALEAVDLENPDSRREIAATTHRRNPFPADRSTTAELWFVDHDAIVWIDGQIVLRHRFEPGFDTLLERPAAEQRPEIEIAVAGSPVTLHQVELDRDLYYSTVNVQSSQTARGGLPRAPANGEVRDNDPFILNQDEFFAVGDNGPFSLDSRYLPQVHDWVADRMFDDDGRAGVVPRDLLMGRAFFVYYPAPHGRTPTGRRLIPNFGDMRFIR